MQKWPHPLEQHLFTPGQSVSLLQNSTQVPNRPSVDGHTPGLGAAKGTRVVRILMGILAIHYIYRAYICFTNCRSFK